MVIVDGDEMVWKLLSRMVRVIGEGWLVLAYVSVGVSISWLTGASRLSVFMNQLFCLFMPVSPINKQ